MANLAGSRKRARQINKRNKHNSILNARLHTFIKKVSYAVKDGNKELAIENFKLAIPIIDQAVSKRLIHKNNAARKKSKLNSQIKALA